jgi:hypothetical protein
MREGPAVAGLSISSCEEGQQWLAALVLLRQMRQRRPEPKAITLTIRPSVQQWLAALELHRQMQQRRLEPNVIAYSSAAEEA